jgi:hypothetical protein
MSGGKKKTREEQIDDVQAKLDAARQARIENAAKKTAKSGKDKQDNYAAFQEYWAAARKSYGRDKDLEEILWPHLKAIGHDSPEKFEAGVQHFGLKKGK